MVSRKRNITSYLCSVSFLFLLFIPHLILAQKYITIKGKVTDDSLKTFVVKPSIRLKTNKGDEFQTFGDSVGNYSLSFPIYDDTLTSSIFLNAQKQINSSTKLFLITKSDTTIYLDLSMPPAIICYDCFLPLPIYFKYNSLIPEDTNEFNYFLKFLIDENFSSFPYSKINLIVHCVQGFNEKKGMAQKRKKFIQEKLISSLQSKKKIDFKIIENEPYFHCTNCNGCFEYYKYGRGINLDKTIVSKNSELDHLRQVVELKLIPIKN